jgi:integrating conjugative element protein (TIGR03749 family)
MKKILLIILLGVSCVTFAQTPQHIVWDKTPINVILSVGVERMVSFPTSVKFGYDTSEIPAGALRVQNAGGTLYLLAKQSFNATRVQVMLNDGKIILLNLSAQKNADTVPLDIVLQMPSDISVNNPDVSTSFDAVTLTRFAFQQLYAPERLLNNPQGIARVAMHIPEVVGIIEPSNIIAMPLISWRGGDNYVTAILLRNETQSSITINEKALCGDFVSSSFYPAKTLASQGSLGDSTTLVVVTEEPIATSLNRCIATVEGV